MLATMEIHASGRIGTARLRDVPAGGCARQCHDPAIAQCGAVSGRRAQHVTIFRLVSLTSRHHAPGQAGQQQRGFVGLRQRGKHQHSKQNEQTRFHACIVPGPCAEVKLCT